MRLLRPRRAQPLRPVGNSRRAPGRQFRPGSDDAGGQPAADSRRHQLRGGGRLPAGLSYGLADGPVRRDQRPQAGGGYPPHLPEADHDLRIHHGHPTRLGTAECAAGGEGAPSSARPNVSPGASRPGAGADGAWRAIRQARPDDSTAVLNRRAPALLIGLLLVACGHPTPQPAPTASPRHTPPASPSPTPPPTPTPLP